MERQQLYRVVAPLIVVLFAVLLLNGCSKSVQSEAARSDGLVVSSISYGLGGELDQTLVTYYVTIVNQSNKSVRIQTVEPVLRNDLEDKLVQNESAVTVNKSIEAGSSLEVTGSFNLNTQGLDKQGIENLHIRLDEFKVVAEHVIGRSN